MRFLLPFILIANCLSLSGCSTPAPIRVGLAAELSGKYSEAGINLRNGVLIEVEEINANGGIAGRQVELVIEDDLGTRAGAITAEEKLIAAGVTAVIGHYTSSQTLAGYSITEPKQMVLFSGTAATSELNDKKDHFFRTVSTSDDMGQAFARYILQNRKLARISILYDRDNASYAEPLANMFTTTLKGLGGTLLKRLSFSDSDVHDFSPLVDELNSDPPDGILLIASPTSTAQIAQMIRLKGLSFPIFSSGWGQGSGLVQNGGQAVEGLELMIGIDLNDSTPTMVTFRARFEEEFNRPPIFSAVEGYETMEMLAAALEKTGGNADGLPEALIAVRDYQGLSGPVRMNEYGDAVRPFIIQRVQSGGYRTVEKISPFTP